jgi:hyperosmotically inducible protein
MKIYSVIKISLLTGLLVFTSQVFSQTDQSNDGNSNTVKTPEENAAVTQTDQSNDGNSNTTITAKTPEEDAAVTKTVKKLITDSVTLSQLKVDVSTNKGVLKLSGNIDSDTQASSLIELAESVIGVSDVDTSELTVKDSSQPLADTVITAKIKGLFVREKLFGEKDIAAINTSVETKDGVVYLSGVIDNQEQIDNAIEVIKKFIPEVKKIEYKVKTATPVNQGS